jgi:uncharacterized tellurite resistance protein B-like protein
MKYTQKILIGAIIFMIVINLVLLGIIWRGHQRLQVAPESMPAMEHRMQRQMQVLHKRLDLDDDQIRAFEAAFQQHHLQNQQNLNLEHAIRKALHRAVFEGNQSKIDSLKRETLELHENRAQDYIKFTEELARTCNPDQREDMLRLLDRIPGPQPERPMRQRRGGWDENH